MDLWHEKGTDCWASKVSHCRRETMDYSSVSQPWWEKTETPRNSTEQSIKPLAVIITRFSWNLGSHWSHCKPIGEYECLSQPSQAAWQKILFGTFWLVSTGTLPLTERVGAGSPCPPKQESWEKYYCLSLSRWKRDMAEHMVSQEKKKKRKSEYFMQKYIFLLLYATNINLYPVLKLNITQRIYFNKNWSMYDKGFAKKKTFRTRTLLILF